MNLRWLWSCGTCVSKTKSKPVNNSRLQKWNIRTMSLKQPIIISVLCMYLFSKRFPQLLLMECLPLRPVQCCQTVIVFAEINPENVIYLSLSFNNSSVKVGSERAKSSQWRSCRALWAHCSRCIWRLQLSSLIWALCAELTEKSSRALWTYLSSSFSRPGLGYPDLKETGLGPGLDWVPIQLDWVQCKTSGNKKNGFFWVQSQTTASGILANYMYKNCGPRICVFLNQWVNLTKDNLENYSGHSGGLVTSINLPIYQVL